MIIRTGIILAIGLLLVSTSASAIVYKNPALRLEDDKNAIGFSLASTTMEYKAQTGTYTADVDSEMATFNFTLNIGSGSAIGFHVGPMAISWKAVTFTGTEDMGGGGGGISYHQSLSEFDDALQMGFFLSYRSGFVSTSLVEADYTQFDGGFGVSFGVSDKARIYAGGVFTQAELNVVEFFFVAGNPIDMENSNNVGALIGLEFKATDTMTIGVEAHAANESAIGFYMDFLL